MAIIPEMAAERYIDGYNASGFWCKDRYESGGHDLVRRDLSRSVSGGR